MWLVLLHAPSQYIFQNVRLDPVRDAITFLGISSNHGEVS